MIYSKPTGMCWNGLKKKEINMERYRIIRGEGCNGCIPIIIYWVQVRKDKRISYEWVNVKGFDTYRKARELLYVLEGGIIMSIFTLEEVNQAINMAVDETYRKAVEVLSSVLDNWVHGGDADCIIAEFEEKLNETING